MASSFTAVIGTLIGIVMFVSVCLSIVSSVMGSTEMRSVTQKQLTSESPEIADYDLNDDNVDGITGGGGAHASYVPVENLDEPAGVCCHDVPPVASSAPAPVAGNYSSNDFTSVLVSMNLIASIIPLMGLIGVIVFIMQAFMVTD